MAPHALFPLAFDLPPIIAGNVGWIAAGLIIVVGLFVIGRKDLLRFQPRRVWAISGVCFDESIRRKVLWITPVAILGVIVISQLQKPLDEQDAIRQTTKFCLFTSGLVVCISTIILACTNLPREIESRVIYTIVTKPTTRLEIVLGKIVGFARVSAAILLIMGIFTWSYLHVRALTLKHAISERLSIPGAVEPISRPSLQHYVQAGLLNAKTLALPNNTADGMAIYAKLPQKGDARRFFNADSMALIPFVLPTDMVADPQSNAPAMRIQVRMGYEFATPPGTQPTAAAAGFSGPSPLLSSTRPAGSITAPSGPAQISLQFFDVNQNSLVPDINGGKPVNLDAADGSHVDLTVPSSLVAKLNKQPMVYLALIAATSNVNYWIEDQPAMLTVVAASQPKQPMQVLPAHQNGAHQDGAHQNGSDQSPFVFLGRQGTYGQQLKGITGPPITKVPVCVYRFRDVHVPSGARDVPIELRLGVEHSGDETTDADAPVQVALQVMDEQSGDLSDPVTIAPENNRTAFASLPAADLHGGNFDIVVRCLSNDQWVGLTHSSLAIVQSESTFGMNLVKSLGILWLLAVLVISISIFCSTFLSWPIAIVLTLVILLGHWGVQALGDAAAPGLGRQFTTEFGIRNPATSLALSSTVEELNKMLGLLSQVLPDISQFSATEDIERGVSIPFSTLVDALKVLFGFGIPLTVLAYVFLKNKEVAP